MKITYKIYMPSLGVSQTLTKRFKDGLIGFTKFKNLMEQNPKYKIILLNIEE